MYIKSLKLLRMATYNNQHWLLSHIRNSFISTDDTGLCETVMLSDDLPKQFLQKCQQKKSMRLSNARIDDSVDYLCYPGLDLSDDEDLDLSSQSFDIQMYPEIGGGRYRSNTAQKLEKLDMARRKAARIKTVKVDDSQVQDATRVDLFERKEVPKTDHLVSRLSEQLLQCPKQPQNKFLQYARFDGTSQTGIATKSLLIFLSMLPEDQRNYPLKICVSAAAKIQEVIGFICYKCSIHNPDVSLQSVRHYGLYITEDNGEMDTDFPPLDLREPCSKFGFKYLTLAERRPSAHITRIDYRSLSMTSETEAAGDAAIADVHGSEKNNSDDMARMIGHNSMIEAPMYRTYRLNIIAKGIFKTEVQLGVSGERIEIDPVQQKNPKFWSRQKAISCNIEFIAYCEMMERKGHKAVFRIWYVNQHSVPSSSGHFYPDSQLFPKGHPLNQTMLSSSPQHYSQAQGHNSFKYYDFETDPYTAQQILDKIIYILDVRSSVARREFLMQKEKKKDRLLLKKPFGK